MEMFPTHGAVSRAAGPAGPPPRAGGDWAVAETKGGCDQSGGLEGRGQSVKCFPIASRTTTFLLGGSQSRGKNG